MKEFEIIVKAIRHFKLNLKGTTVLTEAASGNYKWGPIIAAQAGAKVIAFAKDSRYGTSKKIITEIKRLSKKLNLADNINFVTKLNRILINSADIITNSGFLRPLDKNNLKYCSKTAVIPLMWETWEYRKQDLDITYCFKKEIPVLGTNESYPYLNTISYLGPVVNKLLNEKNIKVYKSNICIVGNGKFAKAITKSLLSEGANCINITAFNKKSTFFLNKCDVLIFAEHETDILYIGTKGKITGKDIKKINPDLLILHFSGNIDVKDLQKNNINYYPEIIAPPFYMSITTDYVSPKPLIDLFTAGLKVGSLLSSARKKGMSYNKSISLALKKKFSQDFSREQKKIYFT